MIRLDGPLDGKLTSIIGVYGPSPPSGREPFLRLVSDHLPRDGRPLLCAGDWNITLSDSDIVRPGGTQVTDPGSRAIGRMGLQKLMTEVGLVDVWRDQAGPAAREYTHWSESAGSGARLDFWLVSPALLPAARSRIEGPVPVKLDHAPVSLTLRGSEPPLRLKGLDSFPLLVFGVQAALDELKLVVASEAEALMGGSEAGLVQRWNDSKERMRKEAHRVYAKHRKERLREAQEQEEEARFFFFFASGGLHQPRERGGGLGTWDWGLCTDCQQPPVSAPRRRDPPSRTQAIHVAQLYSSRALLVHAAPKPSLPPAA